MFLNLLKHLFVVFASSEGGRLVLPVLVFRDDEGDGSARPASSGSPSDSVEIALLVGGQVEVQYTTHVQEVYPS